MANVGVTFRVDSGDGTLSGANAVTGADGTASVGGWTLGPNEGRNVVTALAASLPPVKFSALAVVSARTVVQQTLGTSGGTVAVTSGPLSGASVTVPNAALPAGSWTLSQRPISTFPASTNVRPVGAVLRVNSTNTTPAEVPLRLALPLPPTPAGFKSFVVMRDPGGTAMQVLQTVSTDSGSIVASTMHFDPTMLADGGAAASMGNPFANSARSAAVAGSYDVDVVVAQVPVSALDGDVDTGFRPGTDDWDFPMLPTAHKILGPNARGGPIEVGAAISQMMYFANLKSARGSLHNRYRAIVGVPTSNDVGFRASVGTAFTSQTRNLFVSVQAIRTSIRATQIDQVFYDVLKANMVVSRLPQLLVANFGDTAWVPLTAFRVVGGRIDVANPFAPGATSTIPFEAGTFRPTSMARNPVGGSGVPAWIGATALGQWISTSQATGRLVQAIARDTVGRVPAWPLVSMHARGGVVDDTSLVLVDDTTRVWFTCPECTISMPSQLSGRGIEPFTGYIVDGTNTPTAQLNGRTNAGLLLQQTTPTASRVGFVILESPDGQNVSWLDFQWRKAYKWVMRWQTTETALFGLPATLRVAVDGPTRPAHSFRWSVGSGASTIVYTSTGPSVDHVVTSTGEIPVLVEMLRTSDGQVIARTRATLNAVARSWAAWRITSFNVTVSDNERGKPHNGVGPLTNWERFLQFEVPVGNAARQFVEMVRADSIDWFGMANGSKPGALVYLSKDTLSRSADGTRLFNASTGLFWVTDASVPTVALSMPFGLDNLSKSLASPTQVQREFNISTNAAKPTWRYSYQESGNPLAFLLASTQGAVWTNLLFTDGVNGAAVLEPRRRPSADVTFSGETATGTLRLQYRLYPSAARTEDAEIPWTLTATFTATRIR